MRFSLSLVYFSKRISTAKAISVSQGGSTKGCCCCCSIFNVKCWMLIRERLLDARYSRRVVQVYSPLPPPLHHPEALHNFCLLWRRAWGVSIEPIHPLYGQSECPESRGKSQLEAEQWKHHMRLKNLPEFLANFYTPNSVSRLVFRHFFFYISHSHKADTGYASSAFYCLHTHWQLMSGNGRTRCHIRH